ncbi:MAG: PEGA domain-containing protein [Acidobacteriota bacterium]
MSLRATRSAAPRLSWGAAAVLTALLVQPPIAEAAPRDQKGKETATTSSRSSSSKSSSARSSSSSRSSSRATASSSRSRASSRSDSGSRRSQASPRSTSRPRVENRSGSRPRSARSPGLRSRSRNQTPSRVTGQTPRRVTGPGLRTQNRRVQPRKPALQPTPQVRTPERNDRPTMQRSPGLRSGSRVETPRSVRSPGLRPNERWSSQDLRNNVDIKTPDTTSYGPGPHNTISPPRDRDRRHRDRRGYRHGYYGRHHHHYYGSGCGYYGYGYGYGYDPFCYDNHYSYYGRYSPFSAFFFGGLGYYNYYAPNVYISGGGGSSVARQEAEMGALDLDIKPGQAEVYLDGQLIGTADQYDGYPTYLWLQEGTYEVALYLPGHETIFRQYRIYPGVIIDVDDRLREGEAIRPDAGFSAAPPGIGASGSASAYPEAYPPPAANPQETYPAPRPEPSPGDSQIGRLAIKGSPADAAVYLDGHFVGTAGEIADLSAGLIVEPGDHVIELVRPGYETRREPVSVPVGQRLDLELNLRKQE